MAKAKAAKSSTSRKRTVRNRPGRPGRKKSRGRLAPGRVARGLGAADLALPLDDPGIADLATELTAAGGVPIGAYRDPLSGHALLLGGAPLAAIRPTPFQRDLSPTHAKRLAARIEESGTFLDPLIVVRGDDGGFWTPNGRHRLAAAKLLGMRQVTVLLSPDAELAYRILALNTEKAHNLRDRSREVIRMARALAGSRPRARESELAEPFEAPELLTLGLCYEENGRFAGSAYRSFLSKVDRFSDRTLPASLRERAGHAARLLAIDRQVVEICDQLRARGLRSPYLRTVVVARINPVPSVRGRRTPRSLALGPALTRMGAAARRFDPASVRFGDLALVAAVASEPE